MGKAVLTPVKAEPEVAFLARNYIAEEEHHGDSESFKECINKPPRLNLRPVILESAMQQLD